VHLRELDSADDRAAVPDWRLPDAGPASSAGPLPWLPGVPDRAANDTLGPDLKARADLIATWQTSCARRRS
jgi:hypothetical protein